MRVRRIEPASAESAGLGNGSTGKQAVVRGGRAALRELWDSPHPPGPRLKRDEDELLSEP